MISGTTRVVGVWGHPVGHSRSPAMHNAALRTLGLDYVYVAFEVDPTQIKTAIEGVRALEIAGMNLTVPLKEMALPHLDVISEDAARVGSVNTIHNVGGVLHGYSTDGAGFLRSLQDVGQTGDNREVLILGAGGSARAIAFALAGRGSHCQITNRTHIRALSLAADVNKWFPGRASVTGWGGVANEFDLLINTTSLGMFPQTEAVPALPPTGLHSGIFVYDLIYAPLQTRLLAMAQAAGCETMNGVKMLVWQGAYSLALWTGLPIERLPVGVMEAAVMDSS